MRMANMRESRDSDRNSSQHTSTITCTAAPRVWHFSSFGGARGGHSHMRHINGCDRGHRDFWVWSQGHALKDFWCGHRVPKIFQHCRMGSRSSAVQSRVR